MSGNGIYPGRAVFRTVVAIVLALALCGLWERIITPDIPFRLHHLKIIPHDSVSPDLLHPLSAGDLLLSVNGNPINRDSRGTALLAAALRRGETLLEFSHGGETSRGYFLSPPPATSRRVTWALRTLAAALIFMTGYRVRVKRRDTLSGIYFVLTILTGSLFALDPRLGVPSLAFLLEWKSDLVALFLPPVFLHFLMVFPEQRPRKRILTVLFYLPSILLLLLSTYALGRDLPPGALLSLIQQLSGLYAALLLLGSLCLLLFKALRRKYRREKYRIRMVLLAAMFSLIPLLMFQFLHHILPGQHLYLSDWTPLFLTILPVSFAYSILGPDIQALSRRIRHLRRLVLNGIILGFLFFTVRLLHHWTWGPSAGAEDDILADLIALVVALLCLPLIRKRALLPQKEATPFKDCLSLLSTNRIFKDREQLRQELMPQLGLNSGSSWILWLEREENGYWVLKDRWDHRPGDDIVAPPADHDSDFQLPEGLEDALLGQKPLLAVEQWDPYWARDMIGPMAVNYCRERNWCLLSVIGGSGKVPVLLVLGSATSGTLYKSDLIDQFPILLSTLELHLKNLSLVIQATREEHLRSELELARTIQRRLLPTNPPRLPDLELAGRILTSSEVGGDYYDFLTLGRNRVGLALGDATGHGVPAALLISSVAIAFHNQAADGRQPDQVLGLMNRDLCRVLSHHDQSGIFAGFVYALFDGDTSCLSYCNGGMPAPWIFRSRGHIERLSRGGAWLGLDSDNYYHRGILKLNKGDLLFIHSDGLEDQENREEEMFGEQRLIELIKSQRHLDLESLSDTIIKELTSFSRGDLTDDMSFLFMRLSA
jgi:serine phosphatase RsbU (regulator of sigma subunit)